MTTIIPKQKKFHKFDLLVKHFESINIDFEEKLQTLYLDEFKTYRQLSKILNVNNRTVKKLLDYYNIPIRHGSEAIKSQWVNNEKRRMKQSDFFTNLITGSKSTRTYTMEETNNICKKFNYTFLNRFQKKEKEVYFYNIECNNCKEIKTIKGLNALLSKCCITHNGKKISSNGEIKIAEYLISKNFDFNTEISFRDLYYRENRCKLRFDFGVYFNSTLLFLIEYDGKQHFDINSSRDKKEWQHYINRDVIKNRYCKENNIKLIRIPYFYYDNIYEYLDHKINQYL